MGICNWEKEVLKSTLLFLIEANWPEILSWLLRISKSSGMSVEVAVGSSRRPSQRVTWILLILTGLLPCWRRGQSRFPRLLESDAAA